MAVFIVSYQLHGKSGKDYSRLIQAIEEFDHQKVQDSLWLVSSDDDVLSVANYLADAVEGDDKLWVCEITFRNFAHMNSLEGTQDFLETRNLISVFDENT